MSSKREILDVLVSIWWERKRNQVKYFWKKEQQDIFFAQYNLYIILTDIIKNHVAPNIFTEYYLNLYVDMLIV